MNGRVIDNLPMQQQQHRYNDYIQFLTQTLLALGISSAILFAISAAIGFWVAYDRWNTFGRFGLILFGLVLVGIIQFSVRPFSAIKSTDAFTDNYTKLVGNIGFSSALLAGGIGIFFLLTHNWQTTIASDFTLLTPLTAWLQEMRPAWIANQLLHENQVAGALIILLPIALLSQWQQRQSSRVWTLIGVLIGFLALLLTFSRGAWLGLLASTLIVGVLFWCSARRDTPRSWYQIICGIFVFGMLLLIAISFSLPLQGLLQRLVTTVGLEIPLGSRVAIWQNALALIQDYSFTGSGLGSTPMVLATYIYLLHVPYFSHVHNLFLQITVEQGFPGLFGFLGMTLSTCALGLLWLRHSHPQARFLAAGALIAQVALLIYGLTDAELYVGILVPLIFLPFGLLMGHAPYVIYNHAANHNAARLCTRYRVHNHVYNTAPIITGQWMGYTIPIFVIFLFCSLPGSTNRWQANLTAVAQTRQELALFEWPTWPIQDAVRRNDLVDTAEWSAAYEQILQRDPTHVTALRRLGQIRLSQGDYAQAHDLLRAAYQFAPTQRATRQLLGESYALQGDLTQASALWQEINLRQGQLALRLWWYEHLADERPAQHFAQALEAHQAQ